ncbi:MAG: hypothetical protein WA021_00180 [Minisyncoccia bacterium]
MPGTDVVAGHAPNGVAPLALGERVEAYIRDHDITRAEFARRCGASMSVIVKILNLKDVRPASQKQVEDFLAGRVTTVEASVDELDPASREMARDIIDLATKNGKLEAVGNLALRRITSDLPDAEKAQIVGKLLHDYLARIESLDERRLPLFELYPTVSKKS